MHDESAVVAAAGSPLEERDGELGHNVMHDFPYLDSVAYETLRFFPPVTRFLN